MKEDIKNIINTIKILAIDMIDQAKSGHPGITLGAAPIIYTLYANHLNINPQDPNWFNRDRFVLSASHASALLYATLFMAGYDISLEDLVRYRQIDTKTPGYLELGKTPGVDFSTGPSGDGLAASIGMAIAEKYLASNLNRQVKNQKLINHNIYCLVSDGDLQEGVSWEAISLAGLYNLGNLIVLYDSNDIMQDTSLNKSSKDDILKKFTACGWYTDYVSDGNSVSAIDKALKRAKRISNKPCIIEIKTIIGRDSFNEGTNIVHDKPLSKDDIESLRNALNIKTEKFEVVTAYVNKFRNIIKKRTNKNYQLWQEYYTEFKKNNNSYIQRFNKFIETKDLQAAFEPSHFKIQASYEEELRDSNSKIMNIIADRTEFFLGGSADVSSSCKTYLTKETDFSSKTYFGRNINYGLREHAMACITNGLATYGLLSFASTYLRYSDNQKVAIRDAALMNLPSVFIYTNDTVAIGEDGAINEPVEQLTMLRTIPNLKVLRPGDINEVIGSWAYILKSKQPTALIISKEKTHILAGTDSSLVQKGAYIVRHEKERIDGVIITCGSELTTSLLIAAELQTSNIDLRVVSMVSQEIFDHQPTEYQSTILPKNKPIIAIEAGSPYTWSKYTNYNNIIGINEFGCSGKPLAVQKKLKFDKESIKAKIIELLNLK